MPNHKVVNRNPTSKDRGDKHSDYLGFVHFGKQPDGTFRKKEFTIKNIEIHKLPQGNRESLVAWLEESKLPWCISNGREKRLIRKFQTDNYEEWKGRKIILSGNPNIKMAGKVVGGIDLSFPKS